MGVIGGFMISAVHYIELLMITVEVAKLFLTIIIIIIFIIAPNCNPLLIALKRITHSSLSLKPICIHQSIPMLEPLQCNGYQSSLRILPTPE